MLKYANRYYVDNMHQNNDTRGICRQIARLTSGMRSDACVTRCNQRRRPRRTAARFSLPGHPRRRVAGAGRQPPVQPAERAARCTRAPIQALIRAAASAAARATSRES